MKIEKINFNLVIIGIIFFSTLIFCKNAQALTISPVRIEVSGDPGTTITKDITLFNDSNVGEETFYVSYANFEAQGETGTPLFVEPKDDLGTWMNAGESVTLLANQSKNVKLNINIPPDAYPGGHFAVVFFGTNPSGNEGQVSVGAKTGVLILLSVNGKVLESGGLASFNTKNNKFFYNSLPIDFEYRWKNDGNDRVKPEGKIILRNIFYLPVAHLDANSVSGNILPHSTRLFNVEWLKYKASKDEFLGDSAIKLFSQKVSYQWKNFAIGPYIAKIDLVYGSQNIHNSKYLFFFVFPWQLLIIIFIILIIVFFIGKKAIKRYNKKIIEKARLSMNIGNEQDHV